MSRAALLQVKRLSQSYPAPSGGVQAGLDAALQDVSLSVAIGERVAVVGAAGAGKTSLANCLVRAVAPTSGQLLLEHDGRLIDIAAVTPEELRAVRRTIQVVPAWQTGPVDPHHRVGRILTDTLTDNGATRGRAGAAVPGLLIEVGLSPQAAGLRAATLSPTQGFRLTLARALAVSPRLLVVDEPALDVDPLVMAEVASTLRQVAVGRGLVLLSRRLTLPRLICQRVVVLHRGRVMEDALLLDLLRRPLHPLSEELLGGASPTTGVTARPEDRPVLAAGGCVYQAQCRHATAICVQRAPALTAYAAGRVACHRAGELDLAGEVTP